MTDIWVSFGRAKSSSLDFIALDLANYMLGCGAVTCHSSFDKVEFLFDTCYPKPDNHYGEVIRRMLLVLVADKVKSGGNVFAEMHHGTRFRSHMHTLDCPNKKRECTFWPSEVKI